MPAPNTRKSLDASSYLDYERFIQGRSIIILVVGYRNNTVLLVIVTWSGLGCGATLFWKERWERSKKTGESV